MAKMKDFMVSVKPDEVMYTSINTSKDGYNSARMVIKKGDTEYMSISYEWEGKNIPGFAMDLMGFMKSNNVETSGIWPGQEKAYEEHSCHTCPEHNPEEAKKKEVCKDCGKKIEECKCKDEAKAKEKKLPPWMKKDDEEDEEDDTKDKKDDKKEDKKKSKKK